MTNATQPSPPGPRVLYLFKGGRRQRIREAEPFPTEFFYGLLELRERGMSIDMLDEGELRSLAGRPGLLLALARWLFPRLFPRFPVGLWLAALLGRRPVRRVLNGYDVLVATTQTLGLCIGLLRRLGLVHPRVVFIVMGTFPDHLAPWYRPVVRWLLGGCELAAISEGEAAHLAKVLGDEQAIHFLPFGADAGFWAPSESATSSVDRPYVLSIGNDLNRDYRTLVDAWRPEYPTLRIVTRLVVETGKANVEVLAGDWREAHFSDDAIRQIVRDCAFVVLPIRQTIQPSGQSACLQAMACGKAVIVSKILGLWDGRAMRHGETCLLVEPGSVDALQQSVEKLLRQPDLANRLGAAARVVIVGRLNTTTMADAMGDIVTKPPPKSRPLRSRQKAFETAKQD
jgi:glycosyltransferase involved in cell wall biosynthesis